MWQHPGTHKMVLSGGTCMALPQQGFQQQPGGCLVGSEGGAVFRCSLESNAAARQAFAQVTAIWMWTVSTSINPRVWMNPKPKP